MNHHQDAQNTFPANSRANSASSGANSASSAEVCTNAYTVFFGAKSASSEVAEFAYELGEEKSGFLKISYRLEIIMKHNF